MNKPAIILIDSQMAENVGACARAMLNCGIEDMRLVRPREGCNEKAFAMSSGALDKMPAVISYPNVKEAIADCNYVIATTARIRDQVKKIYTPEQAVREIHLREQKGERIAIMFGGERSGLSNDDIALANAVINVPLNPEFSSLNLAQAVLIVCYEYTKINSSKNAYIQGKYPKDTICATSKELDYFITRLEKILEKKSFFRSEDMKPTMKRNIRNLYARADITEQELRTLHGIITAISEN